MERALRPQQTAALGRIVWYRSPFGDKPRPAIITEAYGTPETAYVQPVTMEGHVHLSVFTPVAPGVDIVLDCVEDEAIDGYYTEPEQTPGTWRWPNYPRSE